MLARLAGPIHSGFKDAILGETYGPWRGAVDNRFPQKNVEHVSFSGREE
jgi:hypothetical protein